MVCAERKKRFAQIVLSVRKLIIKIGMMCLHKKARQKSDGLIGLVIENWMWMAFVADGFAGKCEARRHCRQSR